jgi:hypothetical protein
MMNMNNPLAMNNNLIQYRSTSNELHIFPGLPSIFYSCSAGGVNLGGLGSEAAGVDRQMCPDGRKYKCGWRDGGLIHDY